MFEQKDLDVLKNMMESVVGRTEESVLAKVDERLGRSEESVLAKVDERLGKTEESILTKVDERLRESENLLLEEMERTRSILDNKIDRVQKNLDELTQYYRITRLESDNTALLLKMVDELSRKVEELEKRIEESERKTA